MWASADDRDVARLVPKHRQAKALGGEIRRLAQRIVARLDHLDLFAGHAPDGDDLPEDEQTDRA